MLSTVLVSDLPPNCESSCMFTELRLQEDEIEEVYTGAGGGETAWIVFKTRALAAKFEKDHKSYHFERTGQKMTTSFWTEAIPDHATDHYSDFVFEWDNQILWRTVEITGFPKNHTMLRINELLEPVREQYFEAINHSLDPTDYDYYQPINIIPDKTSEPGIGLLQLAQPWMVVSLVRRYAGTYWQNGTLNARCVPDEKMEDLLVNEPSATDAMFFVSGLKVGKSSTEVREILKDFPIRDVNMPPGGKTFCFVFAQQAHANLILARFKNGVKWQGRTIGISLSNKDKREKDAEFERAVGIPARVPAASPPPGSITYLKLNNLPYDVADSNIRILFEGFMLYEVIVKEGFAFVGILTNQVGRAIDKLNNSMVGGRQIKVKVAERRKQ
ncbi:hypothetical protein BKA58DRAFT_310776 [Alternaria rosae]|uniref:uncharacterized protein n=1 Tax=Alternaria rosae TaxID=1187941 RepID=UPI001E8E0510|nr:uncharacterized protein BKA58DRAFT_310776 [Alternaria rosae]KAH6875031.1 hypothetical protein BKA58DRAFT_310776 [Alternaria rosae]